jgi:hypothetical protein
MDGFRSMSSAITFVVAEVDILVPKCGAYNFCYIKLTHRWSQILCHPMLRIVWSLLNRMLQNSLCLCVCVSVSLTTREPLNCFNYI